MEIINMINGYCQIEEDRYVFVDNSISKFTMSLKFRRNSLFIYSIIIMLFSFFHFSIGIVGSSVYGANGETCMMAYLQFFFGVVLLSLSIYMFNYARFLSTDNIVLKKQITRIDYINGIWGPKWDILYKNKYGEKRRKSIWLRNDPDEMEKVRAIISAEIGFFKWNLEE